MVHHEPRRHADYDAPPIPSYDEATTQISNSDTSILRNDEAEREALLARRDHAGGYRPPTVESARSSFDLQYVTSPAVASSRSSSAESLRRQVEEMDYLDSGQSSSSPASSRLSKHLSSIGHSLSTFHLPALPRWIPSFNDLRQFAPAFKPNYILLGRLFAIFLVIVLIYLLFISNLFTTGAVGRGRNWIEPEALREYILDHANEVLIRDHLKYLTSFAHMAGTEGGLTQAKYVKAAFEEVLEDVSLERFDVYLNYPKELKESRKVSIVEPQELAFEAQIDENPVYVGDGSKKNTPVFHGYSASGRVQGPLIYANYGRRQDFRLLQEAGIDLTGAIALVRYGKFDRALKVRAAEAFGAVGCIIYNDPAEAGFSHGAVYPQGRFMPSDAVERGSVALTSFIIGDPLSPGFASLPEESRRIPLDGNVGLSKIPSIPLAWRDAQKLLKALETHGLRVKDEWVGTIPDLEYWSGDDRSPQVELRNELEEIERVPIFNVIGKISGVEQPDKSIIVGNHRDAWCFGASDPMGGTSVLLEVIRIFGDLMKAGWKPLRSIEFASWDGEEYNLIGSTEHVENNIDKIRQDAFAYLNVDVAAVGSDFRSAASPLLQSALLHVLDRVVDPEANKTLRSLFAENKSHFEDLDAGSDHAAFQMLAGCSSIDFGFTGPPFPYHSCYDNIEWMDKFGDPSYIHHRMAAQILALLILDLADKEILPFDFIPYAEKLESEIHTLKEITSPLHQLNYTALQNAVASLRDSASFARDWAQSWSNVVYGASQGFESNAMALKRISHNTRMANFETDLLGPGLKGREQYKHILMAPDTWDGYSSTYFPYIRSAIDDGDETRNWTEVQASIDETAKILDNASKRLVK